jgi:uncharacterized protein
MGTICVGLLGRWSGGAAAAFNGGVGLGRRAPPCAPTRTLDRILPSGHKAAMSLLFKMVAGALLAYLLVALVAYLAQRKLMYFPNPTHMLPPQAGLADVAERVLDTAEGEHVLVWYGRAMPGRPTILYFHGNAGSLVDRAERIRRFMSVGLGIYMMTYRGYGGSTGSPSERANMADARLAYGALVGEGVDPRLLVVYGESLGTGLAARIAVEAPTAGLVLEAPYTSIVDVAAQAYPLLPVRMLLKDRYETDKIIAQVRVPLLILHGRHDGVIPVEMGRSLARLANEPKRLVIFPYGEHSDLYLGANDALAVLNDWIAGLRG